MDDVKGTIKILETKLRLKIGDQTETYIKKQSINSKSWIEYKGEIYELEEIYTDEENDD